MDLLDRYLAAVARELPEAQRADVTAELRDDLLSMIEAAEHKLGRPQAKPELEAMLVAFGHPLRVAGRYRKTQQLIGPDIFPFWWAWLRAALIIVATVYVVAAGVQAFSDGDVSRILRGVNGSLVSALVFTFGAVTLAAAAVERWGQTRLLTRWTPRDLPPARVKTASQFERVLELAFSLVFLGWWTGVIQFRNWMPHDIRLELAPIWAACFWPILAYSIFECFSRLFALVKPGRVRTVLGLNIVRNLAAATILAGVVQAGHFVEVTGAPSAIQAHIDRAMTVGFAIAALGCLVSAARDAWRIWRAGRDPAAMAQPA